MYMSTTGNLYRNRVLPVVTRCLAQAKIAIEKCATGVPVICDAEVACFCGFSPIITGPLHLVRYVLRYTAISSFPLMLQRVLLEVYLLTTRSRGSGVAYVVSPANVFTSQVPTNRQISCCKMCGVRWTIVRSIKIYWE